MIEKLKKKFIRLTMLAVSVVFIVITIAINGIFVFKNTSDLNSLTAIVVDSGGELHRKNNSSDKDSLNNNSESGKAGYGNVKGNGKGAGYTYNERKMLNNKEMPYVTRYFYAQFDSEKNLLQIDTDNIESVDYEQAIGIAESIIQKDRETGWISSLRYRVAQTDSGYMVVAVESGSTIESMLSVLLITILVSLLSCVLLFFVISHFAGKVVKPIAQSYEKQKRFITDAGHELKTPLTAISANMEIIKMTYGENEWSDAVERQTDKMKNLVERLVKLSKMDEENQQVICETFSLSEAVLDTVGAFEPVAKRKSVEITTDVLSNIHIENDEALVRQLISILVDNAVKYCDVGGKISVKLESVKKSVRLTICNDFADGDKFEPDKVFDRFYRGNKAHTSDGSFGLGLSIAHVIAQKCNIKIAAENSSDMVMFKIRFE